MNEKDLDSLYKVVNSGLDKNSEVLLRIAKLTEEFGELSSDALLSLGWGRKEKLEKFDRKNLEKEFGDVFICLMLLGKALKIHDAEAVIKDRVNELKERMNLK